jgi:hypothetical protein
MEFVSQKVSRIKIKFKRYFELDSDYLNLEKQSSKVEIQPQELQNEDDN